MKKTANSKTRLYRIYHKMKARCYNPNVINYHRYGGRGIKLCDKWQDSFQVFKDWALDAGYDDSLTIDRINNEGNYEPSNCEWITKEENSRKGALVKLELNPDEDFRFPIEQEAW